MPPLPWLGWPTLLPATHQALDQPTLPLPADDPHEYMQLLATKGNWPAPELDNLKAPPTKIHFPFQAQDRMDAVKVLWAEVVKPSWQAHRRGFTDDKKAWLMGFIHGMSGVGKTCFDL